MCRGLLGLQLLRVDGNFLIGSIPPAVGNLPFLMVRARALAKRD